MSYAAAWLLLISSPLFLQADNLKTLGEVKVWQFHLRNGEISAKLSCPNQNKKQTVLWLEPRNSLVPTPLEETDLLRQVLTEMPRLGYDPSTLIRITTPSDNSQFRHGIDSAVARSGKWRPCVGQKYCHQAQPVADQFLASVNAYNEFDHVLAQYGLKRGLPATDDMVCSVNQPSSTIAEQESNSGVSCGAVIDIPIEKTN